jgi:flagellar L-ring protein FlgH
MNKRSWLISRLLTTILAAQSITAWSDSLWRDDVARPMFADKRAGSVGDILTILIEENSTTSKDASSKSTKKASTDMALKAFLYSPGSSGALTKGGEMPAIKWNNENNFDGSGSVGTTEKITARIAVRVIDVLPNRNLIIEGTRQTAFSGETQNVVLRGSVRPEDITANNTIYSYNVADVNISIVSKGATTAAQRRGWLTRTLDAVNPF